MERVGTSIYLLCVLLSVYVTCINGGGVMTVQMIKYVNPKGEGDNGHCCDGRSIFCFTKCDHFFTLCVDEMNLEGSSDMSQCRYGKIQTGVVKNANTIKFGKTIGGTETKNPMTFSFASWPGLVTLKVYVEDHDKFSRNDFVDSIQTNIMVPTPEKWKSTANVKEVMVSGRTSLTIHVRVICDEHFYGPKCEKFCKTNKHYECDQQTGDIICKRGWKGEHCGRRDHGKIKH